MPRASTLSALVLAATGASLLACGSALASEYCITCAGPSAMYRCVIDGSPDGRGTDMREQLACVQDIATAGKHETCTASKSAPYPCPGVLKVVAAPIVVTPPAAEPAAGPEQAAPEGPNAAAKEAAPPEAPKVPATVEELAKSTVANTKEGLKKAGEAMGGTAEKAGEKIGDAGSAVGEAAKKSWRCLSSFFSDC